MKNRRATGQFWQQETVRDYRAVVTNKTVMFLNLKWWEERENDGCNQLSANDRRETVGVFCYLVVAALWCEVRALLTSYASPLSCQTKDGVNYQQKRFSS